MSRSFLAAIRNAVSTAPEPEPAALSAPAGRSNDAYAEGIAAATARFSTILKADGIAGNAARMDAAVDLAARSPDMSAEDVAAFVVANVSTKTTPQASSASLANRVTVDPVTGAESSIWDDPLGGLMGGGLPPAAADGWKEAIARAAGEMEPKP